MAGHDSHSGMAGSGHPETGDHLKIGKIDAIVATDFLAWPRHQPRESLKSPRLVSLLYGMVCVDIGGKEVLLPNPDGIGIGAHVARIWFKTSNVGDARQIEESAKGRDETGAFTYFDIAKSSLVFKAFNKDGKELRDPSAPLKKRNNPFHPWIDFKWVRCLKKLTGLPLIGDAQRNDPALVRTRIWLGTGTVAAFPPFSHGGQHNEWRVKTYKGKYIVSATTDAMIWSRPLPKDTAKVRLTIAPLGGKQGRVVWLTPENGALLCAATHATLLHEHEPDKLTHSKAYARLLKKGDPARFPIPVQDGGVLQPLPKHSSEDVHCECASCP